MAVRLLSSTSIYHQPDWHCWSTLTAASAPLVYKAAVAVALTHQATGCSTLPCPWCTIHCYTQASLQAYWLGNAACCLHSRPDTAGCSPDPDQLLQHALGVVVPPLHLQSTLVPELQAAALTGGCLSDQLPPVPHPAQCSIRDCWTEQVLALSLVPCQARGPQTSRSAACISSDTPCSQEPHQVQRAADSPAVCRHLPTPAHGEQT